MFLQRDKRTKAGLNEKKADIRGNKTSKSNTEVDHISNQDWIKLNV